MTHETAPFRFLTDYDTAHSNSRGAYFTSIILSVCTDLPA